MADLERGERIKALRLERHLTQPAVAEMVGITLRAYQERVLRSQGKAFPG